MSLQHKYRPETFEEFFGNTEAVKLIKQLMKEDPPKAFLLIGPSGCGKTTLAYLIRDLYGCEMEDFIEIDASKDRGIQKMRDISDNLSYVPLAGANAKKVTLLDEVHGITHDAQEAILKTLEKPPKNSMMILATTEPSKLKTTIKRRCKSITLSPLTMRDTIELLDWVLESEDYVPDDFSKAVKQRIFSVSDGSPGIALELLDSLIHTEDKDEKSLLNLIEKLTYNVTSVNEIARTLINTKMENDEKWKIIHSALIGIETDFDGIRRKILQYIGTVMLDPKNKNRIPRLMHMADFFTDNFYDSGKTGLIMACYYAVHDE